MTQKNEVLTREENCISSISTRRTNVQEDYLAITERRVPVNIIEQTWLFEVGEEIPVSGTSPKLVDALIKVMKWLNHLGSVKIDDRYLEFRHNIHHDITIKGIGF